MNRACTLRDHLRHVALWLTGGGAHGVHFHQNFIYERARELEIERNSKNAKNRIYYNEEAGLWRVTKKALDLSIKELL